MKRWLRLTLITATVGGGFTGVSISLQEMVSPQAHPINRIFALAFLAVYIFVVASGLLFIENPKRIEPLAVALAIQIPSFSSPIVLYKLTAGLELYVGVLAGGPLLSYDIGIGSTFQIIFFQDVPFGFGINLVATALLILVLAARKAADPYRARSFGVGH